jgi:hypothetical protein
MAVVVLAVMLSCAGGDGSLLKKNAELFVLTYGALVSTALKEHASVDEVNKYLEQTCVAVHVAQSASRRASHRIRVSGYNIGVRLIDEFLARSGVVHLGRARVGALCSSLTTLFACFVGWCSDAAT